MKTKQILFKTTIISAIIIVTSVLAGNYMQVSIFQGEDFKNNIDFEKYESTPQKGDEKIECDVLIAGGGVGGTAAAISSARLGTKTCLIEETGWIGGMLTSAGVSAIDGLESTLSGIFMEFVTEIENYYESYGKIEELHKCAVSFLCFEPKIGQEILSKMVSKEKNLTVYLNSKITDVYRTGNVIKGVAFTQINGEKETRYAAHAKVTIDATEFGDLMYIARIPYDLGIDKESTEALSDQIENCLQPITYVAILKNYNRKVPAIKPKNYNEDEYKCIIKNEKCENSNSYFDKNRLATYGLLPNGKLMINIPSHSYGNDFDLTAEELESKDRGDILDKAKDYTRGLIYFMQTELGYKNYSLSTDFGTKDRFALIPYVRESRRLRGIRRLIQDDIMPGIDGRSSLESHSIAIGEYPIDLHYCTQGKGDVFQSLMPYQIPYEVTVPEGIDGFMVAEKNISVSHIVNGSTRMQPVIMGVGQAVGIAASLAAEGNIQPRDIDIEELQQILLENDAHLTFFDDIEVGDYYHLHINYLTLRGVISGYHNFSYSPNKPIKRSDFNSIIKKAALTLGISYDSKIFTDKDKYISRLDVAKVLNNVFYSNESDKKNVNFNYVDVKNKDVESLVSHNIFSISNSKFHPQHAITRGDTAVLLARIFWEKHGLDIR